MQEIDLTKKYLLTAALAVCIFSFLVFASLHNNRPLGVEKHHKTNKPEFISFIEDKNT